MMNPESVGGDGGEGDGGESVGGCGGLWHLHRLNYRIVWFIGCYIQNYSILLHLPISATSFVVVPVLVLLELGASCRLGDDDLVDLQDGDRRLRGQFDCCFFGFQMVIHFELLDFLNCARQYLNPTGFGFVGHNEFGNHIIRVQTCIFSENSRNNFKRLGESTVRILIESSHLFSFILEFDRKNLYYPALTV